MRPTKELELLKQGADGYEDLGNELFRLETECGLPLELSIDYLKGKFPKPVIMWAIIRYQSQKITHKQLSGATDKNIEKARLANIREWNKYYESID